MMCFVILHFVSPKKTKKVRCPQADFELPCEGEGRERERERAYLAFTFMYVRSCVRVNTAADALPRVKEKTALFVNKFMHFAGKRRLECEDIGTREGKHVRYWQRLCGANSKIR